MNIIVQAKIHVEDHFLSATDPLGIALLQSLQLNLNHSYADYIENGFCIQVVGQEDAQKAIDFFKFNGNSKLLLEFLNIQNS